MKKTDSKPKGSSKSRKPSKRRRKPSTSDIMKAFLLAGIIIIISLVVSLLVIRINSSIGTENIIAEGGETRQIETEPIETEPSQITVVDPDTNRLGSQQLDSSQIDTQPPVNGTQTSPPVNTNTILPPTSTTALVTPQSTVQSQGTVVIVLDDAGNNLNELEPFLRLPFPFTIAVLPGLPYSAEAARRIRAAGKEVILHQPMEAVGGQNPGPGAIYSDMSEAEIRAVLSRNIAEVGPVTGMNNHQGSKITTDREIMKIVLDFCNENNIYYLDSRTTAETVVPDVARELGRTIAERNVFIDNEQDKDSMLYYFSTGITRVQRYGSVIMIGHVWSPQLASLLDEQLSMLINQGYTIMTALDIIKAR